MSIVNTCYTKQIQEMEFAEKINKQELDKMYEAYMKCLKQNENINDKIKILQEQNKKEVYSIKYLSIFPKEINDTIRKHLQDMKFHKIRNVVYNYVYYLLETLFMFEIKKIIMRVLSNIQRLKKGVNPSWRYFAMGEEIFYTYEELLKDIPRMNYKTKQEIIINLFNHTRNGAFDTDLLARLFNIPTYDGMENGYLEFYKNYMSGFIHTFLAIDKGFINGVCKQMYKLSVKLNETKNKIITNWNSSLCNDFENNRTGKYTFLKDYNAGDDFGFAYLVSFGSYEEDTNSGCGEYDIPEKYCKLMKEQKPMTVISKNGTPTDKMSKKIIILDLLCYLDVQTGGLHYLSLGDMIKLDNYFAMIANKNLYRLFMNDMGWLIKNILLEETHTDIKYGIYNIIKRPLMNIEDYKLFSNYNNGGSLIFANWCKKFLLSSQEEIRNGSCRNKFMNYEYENNENNIYRPSNRFIINNCICIGHYMCGAGIYRYS